MSLINDMTVREFISKYGEVIVDFKFFENELFVYSAEYDGGQITVGSKILHLNGASECIEDPIKIKDIKPEICGGFISNPTREFVDHVTLNEDRTTRWVGRGKSTQS